MGFCDMWVKVDNKRSSSGQKYVVRCNSEIAGTRVIEERPAKGVAAARKTAEILASSLNVTATVYGTDAEGEFVYGVYEVAEGAGSAQSAVIKRLFAESAAASLSFKDQLLANIPEAGEATIIIVEAIDHIRAVYHLAQMLAPAVVILEDLDLITKSRDNPYSYGAISQNDVTGELLQVLSGGSAYADIVTIATTNHPEAIDEALAKRAGRFEAHIRMGYPNDTDKQRIVDLISIGSVSTMTSRGAIVRAARHRALWATTVRRGRSLVFLCRESMRVPMVHAGRWRRSAGLRPLREQRTMASGGHQGLRTPNPRLFV
jgi:ATPase family protein associated with various cellular activities (AAA)